MVFLLNQDGHQASNSAQIQKLREWSLIFSIIILMITYIETIFVILVDCHMAELLDMLEIDISQEQMKVKSDDNSTAFHATNEEQLRKSHLKVLDYTHISAYLKWLALMNLAVTSATVYGTACKKPVYLSPGILTSALFYVIAIFLLADYRWNEHHFIEFDFIWSIFPFFFVIFLPMWYTILLYQGVLQEQEKPDLKFDCCNGFTHTVKIEC